MTDVEAIRQRIPIEQFLMSLGSDIGYTSRSGWTKVQCPFHEGGDKHPSGSVNPDSTRFSCFTCGRKGDIFDLVQWAGLADDFPGAIEWLEANIVRGSSTTDSS